MHTPIITQIRLIIPFDSYSEYFIGRPRYSDNFKQYDKSDYSDDINLILERFISLLHFQ